MNLNSSYLAQVVGNPNRKAWLTDEEEKVALSVIQWLGTPVGQGFLDKVANKNKFSDDDIKHLLFYGERKLSEKQTIKIDDEGKIDLAIILMFDWLEESTHINRKEVERIFWERIKKLTNL